MRASLIGALSLGAVASLSSPLFGERSELHRAYGSPPHGSGSLSCAAASPVRIEMTPTRRAGAAKAAYAMRFSRSNFGVSVSGAGHYLYDIEVTTDGLPATSDRFFVVWVATTDLDDWVNLGPITNDDPVAGQVGWNKFIVFVTAESSAGVPSWSQEFYFSALSPSARMHTMVGHGPFSSEPCLDPRN